MKKRLALIVVAAAAVMAEPASAGARLTLQVTPAVAIAPAWVRIRALVEHNPDNRAIEIVADGDNFYRRSVVELDGESAPKVNELVIKDAPRGAYEITVTLYDWHGSRAVAHQSLELQ